MHSRIASGKCHCPRFEVTLRRDGEYKQIEKAARKELNNWKQKHHLIQERIRKLSMGGQFIEEIEDDDIEVGDDAAVAMAGDD